MPTRPAAPAIIADGTPIGRGKMLVVHEDASGRIVAAISVSSAAQYMSDDRMTTLTDEVLGTAHAISRDLGWRDPAQG